MNIGKHFMRLLKNTLILPATLQGRYHHHFKDEETETIRSSVTCSGSKCNKGQTEDSNPNLILKSRYNSLKM